jgi:hypothetical protein
VFAVVLGLLKWTKPLLDEEVAAGNVTHRAELCPDGDQPFTNL